LGQRNQQVPLVLVFLPHLADQCRLMVLDCPVYQECLMVLLVLLVLQDPVIPTGRLLH